MKVGIFGGVRGATVPKRQPSNKVQIPRTLLRTLLVPRILFCAVFPKLDSPGMSTCPRQTRGNVVAADDTHVAGLNQIWPRQFNRPR